MSVFSQLVILLVWILCFLRNRHHFLLRALFFAAHENKNTEESNQINESAHIFDSIKLDGLKIQLLVGFLLGKFWERSFCMFLEIELILSFKMYP